MITRLRYPKGYQFFDANGAPLALASLSYYVAGTTTLQDTYSDAAGTVPNTNPVVLDASGRLDVDVYLGSAANYKEVLTTASVTISPWPDDNIPLASQPDWNATSGPSQILNKPALATVATSGSYSDLSNTPASFVGDSGSGGSAGLVPAPAAGDSAANKFLSASGSWETLPGTSVTITLNTSAAAASGTTLTFASVPSSIQAGMSVSDATASGAIPSGTTVVSTTSTTVTLSASVAGSGVASGDAIMLSGISSTATNLSASETSTSVSIGSSTGSGITVPAATDTAAGVLDAARAAKIDGLATVATSGSYNDLSNKPTIPSIPSALAGQDLDNVARLGINTTDTGNALSVNAPSVLFSNSGDMRAMLSKGAASNTAAFNFQDNFSTRTQFGLLGNDSFTIATSPDGTTFNNALVASSSGAVTFPNTVGFTGASASVAGASGLVPAPAAGQQGSFLRGDGTWDQMTASQVAGLATSATTDTTNASNISSGTLLAARLPAPTSSTLGGVEAASGSTGQFMTGVSTSGVPQFGTPAYSQISGTPTLGTLASLSGVNNSNWSGTPLAISNGGTGQTTAIAAYNALSPMTTAGDIEYYNGSSAARLGVGSANQLLSVNSGATAPQWSSLSSLIDTLGTAAQGNILYRGSSAWSFLAPGSTPTATIPGQFLQSQGSAANPQWASALAVAAGTTYNINHAGGGNFTDINAALTFFNNSYPNGAVTLQLDAGTHTYTTNIYVGLNWTKKVKIQGATKTTVNVTSIQSTSGSSGNWSAVLNVSSVAGLTTSMYAVIYAASGGTNPELIQGCWQITNVDAVNTRITVSLTTGWGSGAVSSGAVTATCDCIPTIISFTGGTDGFDIWDGASVIQMGDVILKGNGTSGTSGLSIQDQGRLLGSGTIGITGWGGSGVYANLESHLFSSGNIVVSNCGGGIDLDTAAAISATNYIVANGNTGAGVIVARGASIQAGQSVDACGNVGTFAHGFQASLGGATSQTIGTAGRANGNGGYGYYIYSGGLIDCKTLFPANNVGGVKILPIYYDNNNGTPINIAFGGKTNSTAQVTINAQSSSIDALDIYQGDGTTLVAGITYGGQIFGRSLKASAGTSSQAPFALTAGTNLTTAAAGATEYDGKAFYDTVVASNRGLRDVEQFYILTSANSLSNSTSAQSPFPSGSQNFGVQGSTNYFFELLLLLTTGTNSHSISLGFSLGGGASLTAINYSVSCSAAAPGSYIAAANQQVATVSATNLYSAGTGGGAVIFAKGVLQVNAGGTIQPQITFSAAPGTGNQTNSGSYFRLWSLGGNTSMGSLS